MAAFRDVAPRGLVEFDLGFRGAYCLNRPDAGRIKHLCNLGTTRRNIREGSHIHNCQHYSVV
jgi:hypothetical protein